MPTPNPDASNTYNKELLGRLFVALSFGCSGIVVLVMLFFALMGLTEFAIWCFAVAIRELYPWWFGAVLPLTITLWVFYFRFWSAIRKTWNEMSADIDELENKEKVDE